MSSLLDLKFFYNILHQNEFPEWLQSYTLLSIILLCRTHERRNKNFATSLTLYMPPACLGVLPSPISSFEERNKRDRRKNS